VVLAASLGPGALDLVATPDLRALDSPFIVDLHNAIHSGKKKQKRNL